MNTWFYQDDFGWLFVRQEAQTWRDLPAVLFAPRAHGNIRPWSERVPFLLFPALFGIDPLPFRVLAFVTQCANLLLLGRIVLRITGSHAAACWAQILWIANVSVAVAACWTSIYNQFLSAFFLLLPFWLLLRYIDTGRRRYLVWQWIAFLLGLGALEVNIVYPALAAAWCLWFARARLRRILPMFAASGAYAVVHFLAAPSAAQGEYALHFDARILPALWKYWNLALGGRLVATGILTAAIALRANRRTFAFALAWFLIVLAPVLPLTDHVMDYYLVGPAIGLALFGAFAWPNRLAVALGVVYLVVSLPAAWSTMQWHYRRSMAARNLVLGVVEIRRHDPGKLILLARMRTDLFQSTVAHACFHALQIPDVYLAPDSDIQAPAWQVAAFTRPAAIAIQDLREDRAVVYDAGGEVLRNVTRYYRANAEAWWRLR